MKKQTKVEKLYYTYRNFMYDEAYAILNDQSLAEDAVSEAFVRIIKNLDKIKIENSSHIRNFLVIVCRNIAIDIYNKRKREVLTMSEVEFVADSTPEDLIINSESVRRIMDIVNNMNPIYRDTLILSRVYDMSRADIASFFGISAEAVTKRLQRAKIEIKKQLAKEDVQ